MIGSLFKIIYLNSLLRLERIKSSFLDSNQIKPKQQFQKLFQIKTNQNTIVDLEDKSNQIKIQSFDNKLKTNQIKSL